MVSKPEPDVRLVTSATSLSYRLYSSKNTASLWLDLVHRSRALRYVVAD
jgi:hypothetical protein